MSDSCIACLHLAFGGDRLSNMPPGLPNRRNVTISADRQEGGELDDGLDRNRQHQPVLVLGGVGMARAEQHGEQRQAAWRRPARCR